MTDEFAPGQHVCIVGHGTDNVVHSHKWTVDRVTAKQIIVSRESPTRPGERLVDRFWKETGRMVGSLEYGGRNISTTCQRVQKGR